MDEEEFMSILLGRYVEALYPSKDFSTVTVRTRNHPYTTEVPINGKYSVYIQSDQKPIPLATEWNVIQPKIRYGKFWKVDEEEAYLSKKSMEQKLRSEGFSTFFFSTYSMSVFLEWFCSTYSIYVGFVYTQQRPKLEEFANVKFRNCLTILQIDKNRSRLIKFTDDSDRYVVVRDWESGFDSSVLLDGKNNSNLIQSTTRIMEVEQHETLYGTVGIQQHLQQGNLEHRSCPSIPYFVKSSIEPYEKSTFITLELLSRLSQIPLVYMLKWLNISNDLQSMTVKLCEQSCFFMDHILPDRLSIVCPLVHVTKPASADTEKLRAKERYGGRYDPSAYLWCTENTKRIIEGPILMVDIKSCYPTTIAELIPEDVKHRSGVDLRNVMKQFIRLRSQFEEDSSVLFLGDVMKKIANTITGKTNQLGSKLLDHYYYYNIILNGRIMMTHLKEFIESTVLFIYGTNYDKYSRCQPLLVQTDGAYFVSPVPTSVTMEAFTKQVQTEINSEMETRYEHCSVKFRPKVVVQNLGNMCILNCHTYLYVRTNGSVHCTKGLQMNAFWETFLLTGEQLMDEEFQKERELLLGSGGGGGDDGNSHDTSKKKRPSEQQQQQQIIAEPVAQKNSKYVIYSLPDNVALVKKPSSTGGYILELVEKPTVIRPPHLPSLYSSFS